jgi:type VI secretion system protein ImpI
MLMLRLRIENPGKLGGNTPREHVVNKTFFEFGRNRNVDWILQDADRLISGKHGEVRYINGAYWVFDFSTNGIFLNASLDRMPSPSKLAQGDILQLGNYLISVAIADPDKGESFTEAMPSGMTIGEKVAALRVAAASLAKTVREPSDAYTQIRRN